MVSGFVSGMRGGRFGQPMSSQKMCPCSCLLHECSCFTGCMLPTQISIPMLFDLLLCRYSCDLHMWDVIRLWM